MTRRLGIGLFFSALLVSASPACVGDSGPLGGGGGGDGGGGGGGDGGGSCSKTCGGACADPTSPATGCAGASCAACPTATNQIASCNAGACATACDPAWADCDKSAANGCEAHIAADPSNCGGCGVLCGTANTTGASQCASGKCVYACATGFAHCGADPSTGCDTQIGTTDANNCGACGHSCLEGTCSAGVCQPYALMTLPPAGGDYPTGLAIDATSIYVTANHTGKIYKTAVGVRCGGTAPAACPTVYIGLGSDRPASIASDGTNLCWVNNATGKGQVLCGTTAGTNVATAGNATDVSDVVALADNWAWFGSRVTPYLRRVVPGNSGSQADLVTGSGGTISSISFDATTAYIAEYGLGKILTMPRKTPGTCAEGSSCTELVTSSPFVSGVVNDANNVYWIEQQSGNVGRIAKSSGTPFVFATRQGTLAAIATDGVNVYWGSDNCSANTNAVRMAPVNAATACDINVCKELWVGGCVASIVQDAKAIYWSEQTGGIVWKLAK